jgi:hypothetical protein
MYTWTHALNKYVYVYVYVYKRLVMHIVCINTRDY